MFLPLVVVIGLALLKVPPFSAIFIGALTGGALAVIVAPDRVVAFAGADGLPKWLALIKGVWLALAEGYRSSTGFAPIDLLATRGGMESMLNTVWLAITALAFGGVVEIAGYRTGSSARLSMRRNRPGVDDIHGCGRHHDKYRNRRSIHVGRLAGENVQRRLRQTGIRSGRVVTLCRRQWNAELGFDSLATVAAHIWPRRSASPPSVMRLMLFSIF